MPFYTLCVMRYAVIKGSGRKVASVLSSWQMADSSAAAWLAAADSVWKIQQLGYFVFHILAQKKAVLLHKLGLVEKRRNLK